MHILSPHLCRCIAICEAPILHTGRSERGRRAVAGTMGRCSLALAILCLLLLTLPAGFAQTSRGSFTGTVTDSAGAVITGATVTLTDIGTDVSRTATTNQNGLYEFVSVEPSTYRMEVTKPGFRSSTSSPILLQTQNALKQDFSLQVGSASESVTVSGGEPLLEAENASVATVINERQTNSLPLNGRNPMSLAALVPGVIAQGGAQANANGQNPFSFGNYQIGGGFAGESQSYLDGMPVNGAYINITSLIPTQDSLREFSVLTNNLPPEYGQSAGGVLLFTTKSGTNKLHGNAWEYLRNRVLNSNDYFSKQAGLQTPAFTQNQYGANLGGPIYIPHFYDGHNRSFFFVDWEGFSLRQGKTYTDTVPTAAERATPGYLGDIPQTIYDPLSNSRARTAFVGNTIPQNRLDPVGLKLLTLFPLPNLGGLTNNHTVHASTGGNNYETVARIDTQLSEKQQLTGRYTYWTNTNLPDDPFQNGACSDRCAENFVTNNFTLIDTYTFTPQTILDFHIGYQRFLYHRTPSSLGTDLTTFGFPASFNEGLQFRTIPLPCTSGYASEFCGNGGTSTINDADDNDVISGGLTRIAGKHSISIGGEFRRQTFNFIQNNVSSPTFSFTPSFTASSYNAKDGSGSGLASLLLGAVSGSTANYDHPVASELLYSGLYVNDDYHVTPKVTLNLGLRWEYASPFTERHDFLSYFDPTATDPILSDAGLGQYKGAVGLVASPTRSDRSNTDPDWKQFSPRVGFAMQALPQTVVKGGYGLLWLPNDISLAYFPYLDPVNTAATGLIASVDNGQTPLPGALDNPFSAGINTPTGRGPGFQAQVLGQGISEDIPHNPYAYAQQFNFGVQQQFGGETVVSMTYTGSLGRHLALYKHQLDQLPDSILAQAASDPSGFGASLSQLVPNPFYGVISRGNSVGASPTITRGQLLRPFPQYNGISQNSADVANSSFQALEIAAQRRFSRGASINVAYTWSKLLSETDTQLPFIEPSTGGDYGGLQDNNNIAGERALSSDDAPQHLVVSYVLDVPVGQGRRYLSKVPGLVNAVLGDWGVEGATTLQSGFPLSIGQSSNNTNSYGGGQRPNVVPGCAKQISGSSQSRLHEWFNTSCFAFPAVFTFGDETREDAVLRASGVANWDFATYKDFPLGKREGANVEFRAEFFNLFNRVQFGYPNQTLGNTGFGVVGAQSNNPRLIQFALRVGF